MQEILLTCRSLLAHVLSAAPAFAITVNETDPGVGDFDTTNDLNAVTSTIGVLDIGLNSVGGSIQSDCLFDGTDTICVSGTDPTDAFLFELAPGSQLNSIVVLTFGTGPLGFNPSTGLFRSGVIFENDQVTFNTVNGLYGSFLPLTSAGEYIFGIGQGLSTNEGPANYEWSLVFNVGPATPVPLPAGGWLLATGLGGLVLQRSRARRRHPG